MRRAGFVVAAVGVAGALVRSEWLHRRASGRRTGRSGTVDGGREVILVLGCRNRGSRANVVNRYRVRVALRSRDRGAAESMLVFSGGAVGGEVPEADLLLAHAREAHHFEGPFALERASTTTWENIANSAPLLEGYDTVKIASNTLHAKRARTYLWAQRPDLAERLVGADDHRFGEMTPLKLVLAVRGARARGLLLRALRLDGRGR